MTTTEIPNPSSAIAIIGMSGRMPGAKTLADFWQQLCDGTETITFFKDEELEPFLVDGAERSDPRYVKAKGMLEGVENFDAAFFGFSPREAALTDPQHRLFLECAWEALESAGYVGESYPGAIGIYAGAGANNYLLFNLLPGGHLTGSIGAFQAMNHNKNDHLATRTAYKLNLHGPAVTVQTACSTSLVAVHLACQSLLTYQTDMCMAGGVTISHPQKAGYLYHEGGIGSPDGHCRPFDANAQGTVAGSGAGVVLLKRYEDAIADGDPIHALILGSAMNNDGSAKVGYTAPSVDYQAEVIQMAMGLAEVEPNSIGYVEAHGTATPMGDPIEFEALTRAFRTGTDDSNFCALGAVKSNVGHLDTAAGVTGLIKTVLTLKHQKFAPHPHFQAPNPLIDLANSPFYINREPLDWHSKGQPRRAGVSSFGVGGTNAHAILQEAPAVAVEPSNTHRFPYLLMLSARSDAALEQMCVNLANALKADPTINLADVVYTLQAGRKAFTHRRMLICHDVNEAITLLEALTPEKVVSRVQEPISRPVTFMFPGQGAQYVNMAKGLYENEPVFREAVDHCLALVAPYMRVALRGVLFPESGTQKTENGNGLRIDHKEHEEITKFTKNGNGFSNGMVGVGHFDQEVSGMELKTHPPTPSQEGEKMGSPSLEGARGWVDPATQLKQTEVTQPALFVIEYALAQLWRSWGIEPTAMIGHSVGEYVAACLAGVLSLEDALKLTAIRGRLIQSLPGGAMLSVPLSERDIQGYLNNHLALAAVNGPALCVVSGTNEAIDALESQLTAQQIVCTRLHTSHAFHSQMMEPILGEFLAAVQGVTLNAPQMPYLSNVTGTWMTAADATDPHYWVTHLRRTVRFADGLATLLQEPDALLLEVGPGQTLRTLARWHPHKKPNQFMLASLPPAREAGNERTFVLSTIGQLWLAGVALDWQTYYRHDKRRRVVLPTYPFERQRYWIEAPAPGESVFASTAQGVGLLDKKPNLAEWFYVPTWKESPTPLKRDSTTNETWLIFTGETGFGTAWVRHLHQSTPLQIVTVRSGAGFRHINENTYQINPRERADYEALLSDLQSRDLLPQTIVHGWSVAPITENSAVLDLGYYSLLYLAQAIGSLQLPHPIQLVTLSNGMQAVSGDDGWSPEKATLAGPLLVIPREYKQIACRSIDITVPVLQSWQESALFDLLLKEITNPPLENAFPTAETRFPSQYVAYRNGRRWEKRWEPIQLDAVADGAGVRKGGTYLITGGLGGLGLTFAEHLARTAQAKLVLVGRSAFPVREAWATWLESHDAHDRTRQTIQRFMAMEAQGAEILVASADVADEGEMRRVLMLAQAQFGTIHGVIHAAGVPSGGMIQLKTPAMSDKVLAPKIQGTQVLESLFADTPLDFLVLCSSLTSVVGRFGQVDYTAANAYLDAWAQDFHQRTGTFTVAINWGAWDEVGMVVNAQPTAAIPAKRVVRTYTHPLVERCLVDTPDQKVFATNFNVDKHWVLDEHRILGHPVIPGVTYFEMVRAALQAEPNGQAIAFHDMLFMAPLRVRDGETREVRLVLQANGTGYDYSVRSDEAGKERTFAAGKVVLTPAAPTRQHDLATLQAQCDGESLILPAESREEDLGPRWHSVQRVHLGTNQALIELLMPDAFLSDFEQMVFHPALQDRTAGIAKDFLAPKHHYLPFTYHRLTIHAPLQPRIFSHVTYRADDGSDGETIAFDILLMDEQGRVLVEIERFAQKRVNDPAEQIRALAAMEAARVAHTTGGQATGGHSVLAGSMSGGGIGHNEDVMSSNQEHNGDVVFSSREIRPTEGAEALARILAHRITPQVVVSVRDLYASIRFTDEVAQERAKSATTPSGEAVANRPKFPRPTLATTFVPPRDEVEQQIAEVWQEILGIEQVGIHDNFFELGGDSLVGIQLVSQLTRTLEVHISPVSLFEGPTVGALRELVRRAGDDSTPTFDKSKSRGERRRAKLQSKRIQES
jgi:acyl transferase domain-containing protein/acyl carrier protein